MKNTLLQRSASPLFIAGGFGVSIAALVLFLSISSHASAGVMPLSAQMGLGSRGDQVTSLQQFLATNPYIYPEGIVSGFYGGLTQKAVTQFQVNYDLPQVGRVGPMTLARMNSVINAGTGLDISAPMITGTNVSVSGTSATVSIATDSAATAKVYYSASPLVVTEASASFTAPYVSGAVVLGSGYAVSQNVVLAPLSNNTNYYYIVVVTDAAGNVSVSGQATFHVS